VLELHNIPKNIDARFKHDAQAHAGVRVVYWGQAMALVMPQRFLPRAM